MSDRSSRPSFGDFVAHEARHAIHDICQKLFEEAWFGRVVTAEPVMEVFKTRGAEKSNEPTFEDLWGRGPREAPERDKDRDSPDLDR